MEIDLKDTVFLLDSKRFKLISFCEKNEMVYSYVNSFFEAKFKLLEDNPTSQDKEGEEI